MTNKAQLENYDEIIERLNDMFENNTDKVNYSMAVYAGLMGAFDRVVEEKNKYKRAFEILKEKGIFEFKDYTNMIFLKPEDYIWNGDIIEEMFINVNEEEYELLEELMRDE